jgi:hypothetical protein
MQLTRSLFAFGALVVVACSSASSSNGSSSSGGLDGGGTTPPPPSSQGGSDAAPGSDANPGADSAAPADAGGDACPTVAPGSPHTITGSIALATDAQGVPFGTQNGSVVHLAKADLVGKTLVWATAPGGEQIANLPIPTEFGTATIAADLTAKFTTTAKYTNGPWELAVYVSVTGGDITKGPQPGDIAAFDLTPPPACQPPVTGVSIRITIDNADASKSLDNNQFIRF